MDRQTFKQRMQNLKSYRENNPGKGYWDWKVEAFQDGGQTGDPEKERFYQATGRSSSGRPLEEGLKPVFSIEDAANMTPIGDAIAVKDIYDAVKNRDWLGAGLAALTVLPFVPSGLRNVKAAARYIPTVNRTEQIDDLYQQQTDTTDYYRKGTEQKAYMNQLRTMLKQNGDIQNLDEPVSSTLLKKYLDKMSDSDPIKKMFKQHKNINAYTKWLNAIPLLGTTALGANAYFNNNKNW